MHRVESLDPADRARRHGIPITAPARTLIDLASEVRADELRAALGEAYALRIVTERQLLAAAERAVTRPGSALLRRVLAEEAGPAITRSELERRFRGLLRDAGLPLPCTNVRVAGHEVDMLWPGQRLIVELDGFAFHGHRSAFERDRRRDAALAAAGYRVLRFTWRQVIEESLFVAATLAQALVNAA